MTGTWGQISRTTSGKDDYGPFVTRLPSVEKLHFRYLVDEELDANCASDDFYGIDRKDFQLIDISGRHIDTLRRKKMERSLTRNGENSNGTSVWLLGAKRNFTTKSNYCF